MSVFAIVSKPYVTYHYPYGLPTMRHEIRYVTVNSHSSIAVKSWASDNHTVTQYPATIYRYKRLGNAINRAIAILEER